MFGRHAMLPKTPDHHYPPIALVHGWGGSFDATYGSCGWREAAVANGRSVIELDLPGHGIASASRNPVDYCDLAAGLDQRLPKGKLDAVGFSLGGKLLIEIAIRHPSRFRRLVIGGVGDNIFAPENSGGVLAMVLENGVNAETPQAIAAVVAYSQMSKSDPFALAAVLRRPANPVITQVRLRRIAVDVLIVNGKADAIALPDINFLTALPRARVEQLPNTGHFSLPSAPAFRSLALDFLNEGNSKKEKKLKAFDD